MRVDGISRIVCGVTETTTCQDVVIALAQAMGRTGTFTLIEKWRDSERPLNKSEYPVKVLQKWGEYANEVQLLLQKSDQTRKTVVNEPTKEPNKTKENFKHNFSPQVQKEGPVRRSNTFSGVHNMAHHPVRQRDQHKHSHNLQSISEKENIEDTSLTQSLPTYGFMSSSKLQTVDQPQSLPIHSHTQPLPNSSGYYPYAQVKNIHRNQKPSDLPISSTHSSNFSVASSHNPKFLGSTPSSNFHVPSANHYSDIPQESNAPYHSSSRQTTSTNRTHDNRMQYQTQPVRNDISNYKHYNGDIYERNQVIQGASPRNKYSPVHSRTGSSNSSRSPNKLSSPISPTDSREQSPSLSLYSKNRQSAFSPVIPRQKSPNSPKSMTGDLDFRVYSPGQEGNDVVEYVLDNNFPDLGPNRLDPKIEEYHMPGEQLVSSPVQEVEDTEITKMQELVTRQQERIKHQESQLDLINSEISALEKKDADQASELVKLAEEKNVLEQKHKQFESELSKLESTKWVDLVQAERQAEAKIRSEIMEFKNRTTKVGSELKSLQSKLTSLEKDLENEKNELKEEKEKRELEEKQLLEEVEKVKVEVKNITETNDSNKLLIVKLESELKEVGEELNQKKQEVESLEDELKEVNMKEFKQVTPMGGDKGKQTDSGEVVLKVLEGRKSPSLGMGRKIISSPLSKILSVSKNPNGVWV